MSKNAGKMAGKGIGKSLLKKIPIIAGIAGIGFGIQRALEGDLLGAGLEITSGLLGATGVGSGLSFGIDGFLLARDMGMMPMAKGGLLTGRRPVNALMGEAGPEIVTPLNEETFEKFGKGILDAQKRNKSDFIALHKAPVEKAIDGTLAKKSWWDTLKGFFGGGGGDEDNNGRAAWDPLGLFTGRQNNNVQPRAPMVGPPPPVSPMSSTGAKGVLDLIASVESNGSYDVFNSSRGDTSGKASEKTIGWLAENAQGAIGRYQHMPEFIMDRAIRAGYNKDTVFTPEVQDALTIQMLKDQHSLDDFLSGKTTPEAFAAKLAPTWRGLPQGQAAANRLGGTADSTYNDQYASGNKAHMSWQDSVTNLRRIQSGVKTTPNLDLSNLQSLNASGDQANALNRNSMFTSMLGGGMMMPTTVINNYTAAAPTTGSGDSSFGAAFESSGFSPFVNFYSLAAKS